MQVRVIDCRWGRGGAAERGVAGVVLPVPLGSEVLLLPGAGVSLDGGFGGGGAGFGGGAQGGAALVINSGGRPLLRAGINWTFLSGAEGSATFLEFGLIRRRKGAG